ncbi:hypothetical protein HUB98_04385 [Paenibacillus barcinonensis]|uniref:Uncharacterized protein n=1 Tax=Paenibacillus barcinonensis TaxID=198119 RepID=A0A2V4WS87_PAEBA|nr:hypothetical protein [Paenibacillus barcinonensis]PYE51219.1 hypothetical protein DFQ00_10210 [Paenibacillus barcinonensis]QKS55632.1 hypothetical protein HUB98_04385 [Paenibacillus barcinonensis]
MLQHLFGYIQAKPVFSVIYTAICTIVIWLYKEFKMMKEKDTQNKLNRVQRKLDAHIKVEAAIARYQARPDGSGNLENLFEKLGECGSSFSEDIRKLIQGFYLRRDRESLATVMVLIQAEISRVDKQRNMLDSREVTGDAFDSVFKIFNPLKPILIIFAIFFTVLWFVSLAILENNIWDRVYLGTSFITVSLSIMFIFAISVVWMEGELVIREKWDTFLKLSMILSPLIMLLDWKLSILSLLAQIVAGIIIGKKLKSRIVVI